MITRCPNLFSLSLVALSLFSGSTYAADDKTKIGNSTIDRTVQLRTHSLFAPYIDQDLQNRWWDFGADAYVNTNKHIRLTRDVPSQMGWLWSRLPITATNFVVEVEFKVSGEPGHLFGDGMAIWLTKERTQPGPVFGSKDNFEGLAIFLDTYANKRHSYSFPRIIGMIGDGKTSYDIGNDGDGQEVGACSANFRQTNVATKLKITYVKDSFLDVKVQYRAWDEWTDCFYKEKVTLVSAPFLGFSALTGSLADNHDIIAVSTYSAVLSAASAQRDKGGASFFSRRPDGEKGTWLGFFVKSFLFVGVCVGAYYGYEEYKRRKFYGGGGNFGMGRGGGFGGGGYGGMYDKRF